MVLLAEASLIAALSARRSGARVGFVVAVLALPWPWFVDAHPVLRSAFAQPPRWRRAAAKGRDDGTLPPLYPPR